MIKSKIFILAVFVIALGAGITLGMLFERRSFADSAKGPPHIARELNLTEDQDIQMHAIWSKVKASHAQSVPRRDALLKQKDEAVAGILTAEQKTRFADVVKDYAFRRLFFDFGLSQDNLPVDEIQFCTKYGVAGCDRRTACRYLEHNLAWFRFEEL